MSKQKRKKVVMDVNELQEVEVSNISLVKNAANRSPFKFFKSQKKEGNMHVNLRTLFGKSEPEVVEPVIITLVTKTEKAEGLVSTLTEKGIKVTKQDDLDGATTLHLTDDDNEDTVIFKMSDDVAVGVTGISKSFSSWGEGESFIQNLATAGFYPGVRVATDVFMDTMQNIMYNAEAGTQPTDAINKLTADFSEYVKTLVSKLPIEAFKYDGMALEGTKSESNSKDEKVKVDKVEDKPKDSVSEDKDISKSDDKIPDTKSDIKDEANKDIQDNTISKMEVVELIDSKLEEVSKSFSDLLTESVKKSDESLSNLTGQFEKVTEALNGVVSVAGDNDKIIVDKGKVNKTEGDFDSALSFDGFGE